MLKKVTVPAHREYFLRCDGPRGRMDYYDGCCYRSMAAAQKRADAFNDRRDTEKAGAITVAHKDRPKSIAYETTLQI